MNSKLLAAAVIALIPLAGIAAEGEKTQPATPAGQSGSFDTLDSNKDGRISMPEASADPKLVETLLHHRQEWRRLSRQRRVRQAHEAADSSWRRRSVPRAALDRRAGFSLFLPGSRILARRRAEGSLAGHG